jgi:hypothetical protein
MKDLTKLLISLSLPLAFAINPINSKAQDFLPGKFKNYKNDTIVSFSKEHIAANAEGDLFLTKIYDIEGDRIPDVIELYKINKTSLKVNEFPETYIFYFGDGNIRLVMDYAQDGLQKEDFFNIKKNIEINEDKRKSFT